MRGILDLLADELAAEESVISGFVREPSIRPVFGPLVASGPRTAANARTYAIVVECVHEGYLLHYRDPRVLAGVDPDLALLAGDYLYAKGLERLAALGDLDAIRELSDLISLLAQLHADNGDAGDETTVAWLGAAVAIAAGASSGHQEAKAELRRSGNAQPLFDAAHDQAVKVGLDERLAKASEAVGFAPADRG